MARKVYLTIKTLTNVPVVATMKTIVTVEEGVNMNAVVRAIVKGKRIPNNVTVEDSQVERVKVADSGPGEELFDQIISFLTEDDSACSTVEDYEVADSE